MNKFNNQIESKFFQYNTNVENKWASFIIDLGVEQIAPVKELPFVFRVTIHANEVLENMLPTSSESEILYNIGDDIEAEFNKHDCVCAGYFLWNGIREIFYYIDNTVDFKELTNKVMANYKTHEYKCGVSEDRDWELYFNLLMPNDYEYQRGLDGTLIHALESQGDNLEAPRDIDFYIYFENKEDAETVLKVLIEKGYRGEVELNDDGIFGVSAIKNIPVIPNVYSETELFVSLALKHNGNFDGWGCGSVKN